jgi:hypothetical protein
MDHRSLRCLHSLAAHEVFGSRSDGFRRLPPRNPFELRPPCPAEILNEKTLLGRQYLAHCQAPPSVRLRPFYLHNMKPLVRIVSKVTRMTYPEGVGHTSAMASSARGDEVTRRLLWVPSSFFQRSLQNTAALRRGKRFFMI